MKSLIALFLLFPALAFAAAEVPEITFPHKVEIVYEFKKNPIILDVKIEQEKDVVRLSVIVEKNVDRDMAKVVANNLVRLTKSKSLDDKPTNQKNPGKGLYTYKIKISRTDGVILVRGTKPAKKAGLHFDSPSMENIQLTPLTRAGGSSR